MVIVSLLQLFSTHKNSFLSLNVFLSAAFFLPPQIGLELDDTKTAIAIRTAFKTLCSLGTNGQFQVLGQARKMEKNTKTETWEEQTHFILQRLSNPKIVSLNLSIMIQGNFTTLCITWKWLWKFIFLRCQAPLTFLSSYVNICAILSFVLTCTFNSRRPDGLFRLLVLHTFSLFHILNTHNRQTFRSSCLAL